MVSRRAYVDASALVKLVLHEPESTALARYLAEVDTIVTSSVAAVEVPRAAFNMTRRPAARDRAAAVVASTDRIGFDSGVRARAAEIGPPELRTLDAIHLSSALGARELIDVFVTYDRRLATAARGAGFEVSSPGRD